jgi:hypothetical protein
MKGKKTFRHFFLLLGQALSTFLSQPAILLSYATIAFIQLLVLEILCFSTRFPLSGFFNPVIRAIWGEPFVHYPNNFLILNKMFQFVQMPLYIFVSSFFIATAIGVVQALNEKDKVKFSSVLRQVFKRYVHICVAAFIAIFVYYFLYKLYGPVLARAAKISSTKGIFYIIKVVVLESVPYINLLIGTFVTTVFAFVIPIIVIDKKGVLSALVNNFKELWGSFWFIFLFVLVPTLFYLPVILLRGNIATIAQASFPEIRAIILVVSIFVSILVDAVIYTGLAIYYLLKKENS